MKPVLALLASRPVLALFGALALALVVWFAGPLAGLEAEVPRLAVIGVLLLAWAGYAGWLVWRRRASEKALAEGLSGAGADRSGAREEEAAMEERFRKALDLLAASAEGKLKEGGVAALPWYLFIGPPGSGKTTALLNCGLRFPLAKEMGPQAVKGVAGTRACDWWFTDEAVLLDTAGRYTTQDSDAAVDQAGWTRFLDLLKTHRPEQPVNGVLVAMSIADLVQADPAERQAHGRAVRARLKELVERLGVRVPVYVLFTKTDLVAGFSEFFETLTQEERRQVFGATFPLEEGVAADEDGEKAIAARFGAEFDLLVQRLNERVLDRVQDERDHDRRAQIFTFPTQFAGLREAAASFLEEVFTPSRFEVQPRLRGFYFTSGTQTGTPIDRLMGSLAATFGLRRGALRSFTGQARSYFLERTLRQVAFPEAGLVGSDPKVIGRRRLVRGVAFGGLALLLLAGGGLWSAGYFDNQRLIREFDAAAASYRTAVKGLPSPVADGDLRPVLPVLDAARDLPAGHRTAQAGVKLAIDAGLYQGDKLQAAGEAAYRRALAGLLAPRLVVRAHVRLGALLVQPGADPALVERLLAAYLSLSGNGPVDAEAARGWLAEDLAAAGYAEAEIRAADAHLKVLLERPLPVLDVAQPLVERARAAVREQSPAERGYARLKRRAAAANLAPWRPADHGGAELGRVFVRPSGAKLTDGIPGLYTYAAFHGFVLPTLPGVAQSVRDAAWMLGEAPGAGAGPAGTLETEILTLYLHDYGGQWEALAADLALPSLADLKQVADLVALLAGRSSPMKQLLTAIAEQTTLARLPTLPGAPPAAPLTGAAATLAQVATASGPLALAAELIDNHARLLNEFTMGTGGGAPARIDDLAKTLQAVHGDLTRLLGSRNTGAGLVDATQSGNDAFLRLNAETASLPYPVKGWMEQLVSGHTRIAVGGARAQLNAEWQANILPWCRRALDNRYPFTRTAAVEVAFDDFNRLFAPGGLLDGFFTNRLRPYVDTSAETWRWQRVDGVDLGIAPSVLVQFQKAQRIRDAFYPDGGREPRARFDVKAVTLDPLLEQVGLVVDGQQATFPRNSQQAYSVQWPGAGGARQVLVTFTGPAPATPVTLNRDGPWAFLRLMDAAGLRRTRDPNRFFFGVSDGGYSATFEVRAGSALNPLALPDLKDFQCPPQL